MHFCFEECLLIFMLLFNQNTVYLRSFQEPYPWAIGGHFCCVNGLIFHSIPFVLFIYLPMSSRVLID